MTDGLKFHIPRQYALLKKLVKPLILNGSKRIQRKFDKSEMEQLRLPQFSEYANVTLHEFATPTEAIENAVAKLGTSRNEKETKSAILMLDEAIEDALDLIDDVKSVEIANFETPKFLLIAVMTRVVRGTVDMLQQLYMLIESSRTTGGNKDIEIALNINPQEELTALGEWVRSNENNRGHNFGFEDTFEAISLGMIIVGE